MTNDSTYLDDLEHALTRRGLDELRTAEVIREMSDHLAESGERPLEAFGEAEIYAATLSPPSCPKATPTSATRSAPFAPPLLTR